MPARPAPERRDPCLVLLRPDGRGARAFVIPEGVSSIGRAPTNDLILEEPTVSRVHCRLERRDGVVRIEDAGGRNPALVGGEPASGQILRDRDVVRLGQARLVFRGAARRRARPARPGTAVARVAPTAPTAAAPARSLAPAPARTTAPRRAPRRTSSMTSVLAASATIILGGIVISYFVFAWSGVERPASPLAQTPRAATTEVPRADTEPLPVRAEPEPLPVSPGAESAASTQPAQASPRPREASRDAAFDVDEVLSDLRDDERPSTIAAARAGTSTAENTENNESEESEEPVATVAPVNIRSSADAYFVAHVVPFLRKHCIECHGEDKQKGGLTLHEYMDAATAARDREVWGEVARRLRAEEMPPSKEKTPPASETSMVLDWIDGSVFEIRAGTIDPGRVTLRRLNSYEYNYTTRDLLGVDLQLGDEFPADDIGYGFDNIGDVLSLSPLLMEKYLSAAARLVDAVWDDDGARTRIMTCEPKTRSQWRSCGREILEAFAGRAFRRPLSSSELTRLLKIVDLARRRKDEFEVGIQAALQAILVSPHFIFRVELDSRPEDHEAVHPVTDWELASRLSYFLWSSMPDMALFDLAREGKLREPEVLEGQVRRMLRDGKARGLIKTFSALWLGSREMKDVTPDGATYASFDEELRQAMRRETEDFFEEIMREDRSVLLFLDADFTFLNERLARHYGISGVQGDEVRRVRLEDRRRGGILTQGTMLTVTSNPTRTSPVKRGKWLLEQVLGAPPPPPPPGADSLPEAGEEGAELTLREQMERHRADPACAVCHVKMDALGLALENFDGVGAWRETDGKVPIDASGTLPNGQSFRDVVQLKDILLERKDEFVRCLSEKMLTFALGRGLEYTDTVVVDRIAKAVRDGGYRFSVLVLEIVKSEPFQQRRGERVAP